MDINAQDLVFGFVGGMIIGLSVTIMMLFKGRVTGISGMTYRFVTLEPKEWPWRGLFLLGLVLGGVTLATFYPHFLHNTVDRSFATLGLAGFLVGFGTLLGNGCTSGHGVCGISRFSIRSLIATMAFMFLGILTVWLFNALMEGA